MNFLIDTNIVIPLEPTSKVDLEINTDLAIKFHQLASSSESVVFIHPSIAKDLERDKLEERRELRKILINRYHFLKSPPSASILDSTIIGNPEYGSNSWVDNNLLAALKGNLIDYLVTEDIGIHKKAKRLNLESRVLLLADAVVLIRDLFDTTPSPPPTVANQYIYEIDTNDLIFNSLREDYQGFNEWLIKCKRDHRHAYVVKSEGSNAIAAIAILKKENNLPNGQKGKVLKICTFKVSPNFGGNKLGELLLKAIFEYLVVNKYRFAYFTTYEKQDQLIEFAKDFGFFEIDNNHSDQELAFCKNLKFKTSDIESISPFDFHLKFGPRVTSFNGNSTFIIPIRPNYHNILFPELEPQKSLFPVIRPCGNSIRKAYLSHSLSSKIKRGDNIIFYRSYDIKAVTCIGIAEDTFRSNKANEIAQYVGSRTVYTFSTMQKMCSKPVLAVKFRLVQPFSETIHLRTLRKHGIVKGQPQSITEISPESIEWLKQQLM
ncbi:GNAT family N-acetyltransferase [Desulfobacterota bacterium M19]